MLVRVVAAAVVWNPHARAIIGHIDVGYEEFCEAVQHQGFLVR